MTCYMLKFGGLPVTTTGEAGAARARYASRAWLRAYHRDLAPETQFNEGYYPIYRRRETDHVHMKGGKPLSIRASAS